VVSVFFNNRNAAGTFSLSVEFEFGDGNTL